MRGMHDLKSAGRRGRGRRFTIRCKMAY